MVEFPDCPDPACEGKLTVGVPAGTRGGPVSGPIFKDVYPAPELAECEKGHKWHRWSGDEFWKPGVG